jgi:MFS family permease
VPLVVGGLLGGSIADSHDRRTVALLSSAVLWLTTGGLALQAWLQVGNVWLLYALVAVQSGAQAINQPARNAIIPALLRKELLPAANALNMVTFGLSMTAGPLLAGVLVASVGFGWTYTLDVVSFRLCLLGPAETSSHAARSRRRGGPACGPSSRASGSWARGPTCG